MKRLLPFSLLFGLVLAVAAVASCKQGIGDRCQVDSDCAEGVCNQAEHVCATRSGGGIDATPPIDAPPPVDAAIDAPPDAPPD